MHFEVKSQFCWLLAQNKIKFMKLPTDIHVKKNNKKLSLFIDSLNCWRHEQIIKENSERIKKEKEKSITRHRPVVIFKK